VTERYERPIPHVHPVRDKSVPHPDHGIEIESSISTHCFLHSPYYGANPLLYVLLAQIYTNPADPN